MNKTRLFFILWAAGMAGVLSFLLVDLRALLTALPATAGAEIPLSPMALKLVSIVQPTVLLSLAVLAGVTLAPRVGLSSPAAEAVAGGGSPAAALRPQIAPGVVGGLAGGISILVTGLLWKPFLPPELVTRSEALAKSFPLPTRLLYGGVTEELLLRWGVMTILVWAGWRLFQKGRGAPRDACYVGAIVVSSIVFGLGHLPLAHALGIEFTVSLVSYVVVANSVFGCIAGYLYWKKGLESAVLAHMVAHVVLAAAALLR